MKGAAKGGLAKPGLQCPEKGRPVPAAIGGMKTSKSSSSLSSEVRLSKLKRASSDDTLAKPGLGSALATSRMRKTTTTGAISELAEARPRGIPGKELQRGATDCHSAHVCYFAV
ncbi:cytospin-B-like isoform X1 [Polyodon spathula]|uniref:cytospin-B-like isoform X1 n=1 Tax=Polyodon spathula TaxID=7913 RepID=UPI001B7D947B|nr:cytospin-B-like isoform X1 [Polyodon spathula]XP_041092494.1 cytospin-B-like isoform X1 [Polyodon spathula]XP_041092496.1 cytospin-B-like isoform X1 [Polyodon spathula]XP_041092497.1 cytospin-B-like isoform X1 [Polyodon spathula]